MLEAMRVRALINEGANTEDVVPMSYGIDLRELQVAVEAKFPSDKPS
jgi:hypothetical protein